jgi:hypothetical protein
VDSRVSRSPRSPRLERMFARTCAFDGCTHQPKGASVEDTVRWARWFLAQYGEEFPEAT